MDLETLKEIFQKSEEMTDDHKLDRFEYVVYVLKGFIEVEGESDRKLGGAFLGRQAAYEEILRMLTGGEMSEYK